METILFSPTSNPILKPKPKPIFSKSLSHPRLRKLFISSALKKPTQPSYPSRSSNNKDWFSYLQHGLAAAVISISINFYSLPAIAGFAVASEFDVVNERPPRDSYVVDDAGVLSRVTKYDLQRLLSDVESRKNLHINFVTVRKLTSKADAFEYADQLLEKWYPLVEEGNNKGIVVLVTTQKEGAITGGPTFVDAVGEKILDAIVSENLPEDDAGVDHHQSESDAGMCHVYSRQGPLTCRNCPLH